MVDNIQRNLSPSNYRLKIGRLPNTSFYTTQVILPSIVTGIAQQQSNFVSIPWQGGKVSYSDLTLTVIADEDLTNYKELKDWIEGLNPTKTGQQYKNLKESLESLFSDMSLIVTNNNNNPNLNISFSRCFPLHLSNLVFTSQTDSNILTFTVGFAITNFDIQQA